MNSTTNTKRTGDISTSIILSALLEAGYAVSIPWGDNQRYDLVAEKDGVFWRIQCKTAWGCQGRVKFNSSSMSTLKGKLIRYSYGTQVDCFMVWCPSNKTIYCVPSRRASKTTTSLRIQKAKKIDSRILLAESFVFRLLPPR